MVPEKGVVMLCNLMFKLGIWRHCLKLVGLVPLYSLGRRNVHKHEQIVSDLQGHIKRSNICVTGVPKGEKEKISTLKKKKFEDILANNILNLVIDISL